VKISGKIHTSSSLVQEKELPIGLPMKLIGHLSHSGTSEEQEEEEEEEEIDVEDYDDVKYVRCCSYIQNSNRSTRRRFSYCIKCLFVTRHRASFNRFPILLLNL